MDNNEKFNSISDLYKRLLPALHAKVSELKRENYFYIDALDIWNYAMNNIWKNKNDLRIYEMVSDIFSIEGAKIDMYVRKNVVNYKKLIDKEW